MRTLRRSTRSEGTTPLVQTSLRSTSPPCEFADSQWSLMLTGQMADQRLQHPRGGAFRQGLVVIASATRSAPICILSMCEVPLSISGLCSDLSPANDDATALISDHPSTAGHLQLVTRQLKGCAEVVTKLFSCRATLTKLKVLSSSFNHTDPASSSHTPSPTRPSPSAAQPPPLVCQQPWHPSKLAMLAQTLQWPVSTLLSPTCCQGNSEWQDCSPYGRRQSQTIADHRHSVWHWHAVRRILTRCTPLADFQDPSSLFPKACWL